MVKAGELGGVLEVVLTRLAEFQEKAQKIKDKVISAMIYPVIVMTMAVVIMGFLLVFIVPRFEAIFNDMLGDKPLPGITIFVISISNFAQGQLGDSNRRRSSRSLLESNCWDERAGGRGLIDQFKLRRPAFRRSHSQDRDFAFLAHARHAGHERRFHFAGVKYYPRYCRQYRHRQCHLAGARSGEGRRIDRAAARNQRRLSADGHEHDRCRRRNWSAARHAVEDCGCL